MTNAAATVQYSQFVFQTWQDSSKVTHIDAPAVVPSPASTRELFQAELVSQYLSGTFTAHAAANTSVVFAFELAEDLAASFSIYITAPCDDEFPTLCEASVGPDVSGSTLSAQVTKYISFPDTISVACAGLETEATLHVTPTESMSTFPALPGFLFVFGVDVTNPSVTADVNTWRLLVTDRTSRQEASIVGYDLSDLKTPQTAPRRTCRTSPSFPGRSSIPTQTEMSTNSFDRGILRIEMPEGFTVPTSTSTFCQYWSELYEVGLSDAFAVSNSMSEASNQITLHNRGDTELTAIEYVFNVTVRNPNYAQEARTWHFATYQSEAALDDDLINEAYMTGFPSQLKATVGLHGSAPRWAAECWLQRHLVEKFELVNELLSRDSLVLIGPQEYEFDCSGECRNVVSSLAAPSCSGNVLLVSYVGVSDALVPNLGDTDRTVAPLEFDVTVPTTTL